MGCGNSKNGSTHRGKGGTKGPPDASLEADFEFMKLLGKGGTGETYLYRERRTGQLFAIKLVPRPLPRVLHESIVREITIQAQLGEGHVNIVAAREVLLTAHSLAICMEYASGGNLTAYVTSRWPRAQARSKLFLSEDEARYYFRQFISAVSFCHRHNIAHRDLKLDNTLLDGSLPARIKLCDFGFAKGWNSDDSINMQTLIGTPAYMAPEQLHANGGLGYLGTAVDVWASGIMLLVMLLGTFPFDNVKFQDPDSDDAHRELWLQQIERTWSNVPHIHAIVNMLSAECRDLLDRIFVVDDAKRITIDQIRQHPWYNVPLSPLFRSAEAQIAKEQAVLDARNQDRRFSSRLRMARLSDVEALVKAAEAPPKQTPAIERRVNLAETSLLSTAASLVGRMNSVTENGAEMNGSANGSRAVPPS